MKLLNKVSIRMRITLLTGAILFAISVLLTLSSMYNARNKFILPDEIAITKDPNTGEAELVQAEKNDVIKSKVTPSAQVLLAKKQFDIWSYIYLIIFSSIGMIATYIITGKALKPLQELNDSIINITEHNLKGRIPTYVVKDEIGSLVTSYNAMLERLNESFLRQKRFSSSVSHELKTPLSIMNAGIQVLHLDEEPTVEEYKETIEMVERNTKRLMNIVEDLFLLTNESCIDAADEIDLKKLFLQIEAELQPIYNDKNIYIDYEFGFSKIVGNKTLIYEAFFNLVENAMKYNSTNGKVEIKTLVEDNVEKIIISDSGIGIPAENINKIFEPFYRVDPSRSRKIAGAGLGLSLVKSIIEKHGWKIELESTVGVGTCFEVSRHLKRSKLS
ncbi:HAMP domain-containing protein [Clostridium sp. PL3]|uniref:histidine kinase n=1 Tax=Clostridium thailandense TaxID=2794346 RepID=A0A949U3J5_9CLOT|nr:ATP-binding protein [Clostridium thailandense]MBV7276820.1 HAMP domain-containing protein [Clostridium thailandense]